MMLLWFDGTRTSHFSSTTVAYSVSCLSLLRLCVLQRRMDAPLAPKLCAGVLGRALLQGVLPPDSILEFCKPIEGGEVRRALIAPALQYVKVRPWPQVTHI